MSLDTISRYKKERAILKIKVKIVNKCHSHRITQWKGKRFFFFCISQETADNNCGFCHQFYCVMFPLQSMNGSPIWKEFCKTDCRRLANLPQSKVHCLIPIRAKYIGKIWATFRQTVVEEAKTKSWGKLRSFFNCQKRISLLSQL